YVLFFQAEDGIRDFHVTGVQTCALPISSTPSSPTSISSRTARPPPGSADERRLHRLAAGRSGAGQRRPASSRTPGAVLRERERYGALFTVAEAISAPSEPASTTLRTLLRPGSATSRASSCGAKHLLTAPA